MGNPEGQYHFSKKPHHVAVHVEKDGELPFSEGRCLCQYIETGELVSYLSYLLYQPIKGGFVVAAEVAE